MLFKLSNLNANLAPTLGYLKPALNNSAPMMQKPNSIIVLLFIQNNSYRFKTSENMFTSINVKFIFDNACLSATV